MKRRSGQPIPGRKPRPSESARWEIPQLTAKNLGLFLFALTILLSGYETAIQTYRSLPERERAYYESQDLFPEDFRQLVQSLEAEDLFQRDFLISFAPQLLVNELRRGCTPPEQEPASLTEIIYQLPIASMSANFSGPRYQNVYSLSATRQRSDCDSYRGWVSRWGKGPERLLFAPNEPGFAEFSQWAQQLMAGAGSWSGPEISKASLTINQSVPPPLIAEYGERGDPLLSEIIRLTGGFSSDPAAPGHIIFFGVSRNWTRNYNQPNTDFTQTASVNIGLEGYAFSDYPPSFLITMAGGKLLVRSEDVQFSWEADPQQFPFLVALLTGEGRQ